MSQLRIEKPLLINTAIHRGEVQRAALSNGFNRLLWGNR